MKSIFFLLFAIASFADCPFCDEETLERQKIAENSDAIALVDYKPITQGHLLLIPKRHVTNLENITDKEWLSLLQLLHDMHAISKKTFDIKDFLILQKNGPSVGQSVDHIHIHYIPRKKGSPWTLLWRFFIHGFFSANPQEMEETLLELQKNLSP